MGSENEILKRIKEKVGLSLDQSVDFEILAQDIKERTGHVLGANTLKRFAGYKTGRVVPRLSTMDIISMYLGFSDYAALQLALGEDADISAFTPVECVQSADLENAKELLISYEPDRELLLTYTGNDRYIVTEAHGSKNIRPGDELIISQFVVGHRLVAKHVFRDGKDLGAYEAAKSLGITRLVVKEG